MQGIKIDFTTNRIIITRSFGEAANILGSEEYCYLMRVKKDNPQMTVAFRSINTSNHKNSNKGLTYKYMRKFISTFDINNLITFENTILHYENYDYHSTEVYRLVRDWFLENYPNHREMIVNAAPKNAA